MVSTSGFNVHRTTGFGLTAFVNFKVHGSTFRKNTYHVIIEIKDILMEKHQIDLKTSLHNTCSGYGNNIRHSA